MNETVLGAVLVGAVLLLIAGRRFMRWFVGTDTLETRLVEIRDLLRVIQEQNAAPASQAIAVNHSGAADASARGEPASASDAATPTAPATRRPLSFPD